MSLFVSSHYKNSPNDLQLLCDAPAHSIFVLTKSITKGEVLPDIYAAIQIAEEGGIPSQTVQYQMNHGYTPAGDLIPWTIGENFQDLNFPSKTGIRIVRVATHSQAHRMGYGSRALEILTNFYEGKIINLDEAIEKTKEEEKKQELNNNVGLYKEVLKPRKSLKPLLCKLSNANPTYVDWIGTSFEINSRII